jgi:hypothetical protein
MSEFNIPPIDYLDAKQDPITAEFVAYAEEPFRVGAERAHQIGAFTAEAGLKDMLLDNSLAARSEARIYKNNERLNSIIIEAEQKGVVEPKLRQLGQMLSMQRTPRDQHIALGSIIRRDNLSLKNDELLSLMHSYQKESVRSTENGILYHYHQTDTGNLETIIDNGGLLSTNEQKQRGIKRQAAGSRPDVVQMTRDKYDFTGKLLQKGISDTSAGLGSSGDMALVFDESIMDDPNYDCTGMFPNVPEASLGKLRAVLVSDEKNMPHVQEVLASRGIKADVLTRTSWLNRYGQQPSGRSY